MFLKGIRYLVILLTLGLVSGCASIPLTSMIQMAAMSSYSFEKVDPSQLRVRVSVSSGFEVDVVRTALSFSITRPDGTVREEKLSLELIERTTLERADGFMRRSVPLTTYLLSLTPADVKKLSALKQSALAKDKRSKRTFSVSAPFSKVPSNPKSVKFWADLKFSNEGSWIALLDGAEIYFKNSPR